MGSAYPIVFLFLTLVLQTWPARSDNFISPIFSPLLDDICNGKECGKGSCKVSSNNTFGYACECDHGWKQARGVKDDGPTFMPCVIPNCSLNLSCSDAPPPVPDEARPANTSIIDPCYWADCGGGTCSKTSIFSHRCECSAGYYNLLNVTSFPCFKECALGTDCANLGITVMNKTVSPPSSLNSENHGSSTLVGDHKHSRLFLTALFLVLAIWK